MLPNRSTIASFDGQNKVNGVIPPTNQSTDWDNPSLAGAVSDVAALGQTACRFWARLTLGASSGAITVVNWYANWSNATLTAPIATFISTGKFTLTLPTLVSDEYDASLGTTLNIPVNLTAANGNIEGLTFGFLNCSASGNVITINIANTSGSLSSFVGTTISVFAY